MGISPQVAAERNIGGSSGTTGASSSMGDSSQDHMSGNSSSNTNQSSELIRQLLRQLSSAGAGDIQALLAAARSRDAASSTPSEQQVLASDPTPLQRSSLNPSIWHKTPCGQQGAYCGQMRNVHGPTVAQSTSEIGRSLAEFLRQGQQISGLADGPDTSVLNYLLQQGLLRRLQPTAFPQHFSQVMQVNQQANPIGWNQGVTGASASSYMGSAPSPSNMNQPVAIPRTADDSERLLALLRQSLGSSQPAISAETLSQLASMNNTIKLARTAQQSPFATTSAHAPVAHSLAMPSHDQLLALCQNTLAATDARSKHATGSLSNADRAYAAALLAGNSLGVPNEWRLAGSQPIEPMIPQAATLPSATQAMSEVDMFRLKNNDLRNKAFPIKLLKLLEDVVSHGKEDIISWRPSGWAFKVHDRERFASEIMSRYFRMSKMSSYRRQLSMYGFGRIQAGPDQGSYAHALFRRDRPDLACRINRVSDQQKGAPRSLHSSKWRTLAQKMA